MFNLISILIKIFFTGVFIYIVSKINFLKLSINLYDANLIFASIFFFLFHYLRACKVKNLINIKNKIALKIYFIGFFWGFITPGRVGDFLKIFYLKKKNKFLTFKIFFYDKIVDVFWILFFSVISIFFLSKINTFIFLISFFLLLIISYKLNKKILRYLKLKINLPKFIYLNFFSVISIIFYSFGCLFIFKIFTNDISILDFTVFILALGITLLPISYNGLGTRELVFLYYLKNTEITNDEILISSFTIFLLINLIFSVIGMIIYLLNKKVAVDKKLLSKFKNKIAKNFSRKKN